MEAVWKAQLIIITLSLIIQVPRFGMERLRKDRRTKTLAKGGDSQKNLGISFGVSGTKLSKDRFR